LAYQVWAFSGTSWVAYLENAFDIQRSKKANQTPTLSFSLPADDAKTSFLTSAYEIQIWNTITEAWEGLYTLDDADEKWNSSGSIITVNYSGLMAQLAGEDNKSYDTTVTPKTPTQIITALLALQENANPITVGTIQPSTSFAYAVENANLLGAILDCVKYLGGYIEVDDTRKLNWYNEPSGSPVREIRYQKNMKGVSRRRDFTAIRNKIYAYGAEYPDESRVLNLTDAGEANEYIEDAGIGSSQALYGIKIKRITNKSITHPATLLLWAQRLLLRYKDPIYYYSVDVVNLAEHSDFDFDFENLEVGQIVRVVNSDLNNLNVNVKIVAVTTQLDKPENIKIELANATEDISDSFNSVNSKVSLSDNLAVQIGCGQVTILGGVVISDWVSPGVTTINGGQITALSITAASIAANTITADKLTASYIVVGGAEADITTISGAKITTNTIECSSLKTSSLIGKTITVGSAGDTTGALQSYNFITGPAGSGWQIKSNGNAELNNVVVRGTIYATAGEFAGTLKATNIESGKTLTVNGTIQSTNYTDGSGGWQIDGGGSAKFWNDISTNTLYAGSTWTPYCYLRVAGSSSIYGHLFTSNGINLRWSDKNGTVTTLVD